MQLRDFRAKTIVVRLPNWVGDAVMATPALRALRQACEGARLIAIATPPCVRLLAGLPWVDEWIAYSRHGSHRGWGGAVAFARSLRPRRADLWLVFPHSFSSALQARLGGARLVAGYHTLERGWLLHAKPRAPRENGKRQPAPMTRHYLDLLAAFGAAHRDERMELCILPGEEERARALRQALGIGSERYFAVNPGASFGASKLWTLDGFAETIRLLHQRFGGRSLVLCGPGEEALARDIAVRAGPAAIDTSSGFIPLELLKPVLRDAALLVTTDTGPRHIAAAVGTPQVVVMGPTDPRYSRTNLEWTRVLRKDVECSPCHKKICPIDHRCMTRIAAAEVVEAAADLLQRSGRERQETLHA